MSAHTGLSENYDVGATTLYNMLYLYKFPRNEVTHRSSTNWMSVSINLLLKNIYFKKQNVS